MKQLISFLFFFMLSWNFLLSQEVVFGGKISEREDGSALSDVTVKAIADGTEVFSTTTNRRGSYTVRMPVGKIYTIKYEKPGYVTKTMRVNLTGINEEDLPIGGGIMPPVDIDLFTDKPTVDFSFLENEPVVTWEYDKRSLVMDWDRAVYNKMKERIDKLLAEAEDKSAEREAKYNALIKEADEFYTKEEYESALAKYEAALQVPGKQTEEHPNKRLMEIEAILQKLAEEELAAKQGNQEYQNLLDAAENLAKNKEYDKAIEKYNEAIQMKPEEQFPKDRINELEALKKAELDEKEYNELITQADNLMTQEDLKAARDKYVSAAKLFPEKEYPKEQLQKIDEQLAAESEAQEKKQKYDDAIAEADRLFNEGEYERAIVEYEKAISFDNAATYPLERIEKAREKLAEQKAQEKIKEQFDAIVKQADQLANAKNYEEAITKYDEALALMSTPEVESRKKDALEKLEASQNEEKRKEQIEQLLASADKNFQDKNYQDALNDYQAVLSIDKSNVKAIEGKNKAERALEEKKEKEKAKEEFDALVAQADNLFDQEKWTEAQSMYEAANKVIENNKHVIDRLSQTKAKIEENKELAEKNSEIQALIDQAARQRSEENFDAAIASYEQILSMDSGHAEAKKLLDETRTEKAEWEQQKNQREKFEKIKKEADLLFAQQKWNEAKAKYEEAFKIQENQEVKDQLSIIEKELSKLSSEKEKAEKYQAAINEAKNFENSEEYSKAIDKYKEALNYKEGDSFATNKIADLNLKIEQVAEEQEEKEKYEAALKEGKDAFEKDDFAAAIKAYDDALEIKPMDPKALELKQEAKSELEKLSANEEKYQELLSEGKEKRENGDLLAAKKVYEKAQSMRPSDAIPQNAIVEIDEMLRQREEAQSESEKQARIDTEYQEKLDLAKVAAQDFKYQNAIDYLKEASSLKPEEDFPKKKINEYQALLDQIEAQNSKEENFDAAIRKADQAFVNRKYEESIDLYNKALEIKENDDYALKQIQEAKAAITNEETASVEMEYQNKIVQANQKYDAQAYEKALTLYEEALAIKPGDKFAADRRDEVKQILENLAAKEKIDSKEKEEFNKLIKEADNLFKNKQFIDAKEKYEAALKINPNDVYAIKRVQESIDNAKSKVSAGDEARYQKILTKADEYFVAENYDKAKSLYERALGLRSYDQYPKDKLAEIDAILNGPVKKERTLEYLGEKEDISILEGAALLSEAEQKRKENKSERVMKRIRANEDKYQDISQSDYEERIEYQNEIEVLKDRRSKSYENSLENQRKLALDINNEEFSISQQRAQENKYERGSVLRQNEQINYIIDDQAGSHREKSEAHLINADKLDEIEFEYEDQSIAEGARHRQSVLSTNENLEDISENMREEAQRAVEMGRENADGIQKIEQGKEIREFQESNDNYDKLQDIEDQATLAEIKEYESTQKKRIIQNQLNEDIALLEGNLKRKAAEEHREIYKENLKADALLTDAAEQYKESQADNDESRRETVEKIKDLESDHEEMMREANKGKAENTQDIVNRVEAIKDLEREGALKMQEDLLAINEEVKNQEKMLDQQSQVRNQKEQAQLRNTENEIKITKAKEASARQGKEEQIKENNEKIKGVEASIDAGRQAKSEVEKDKKLKTQKYLDGLETNKIQFTEEIANTLGDEFPEGVSQETYVRRDSEGLAVRIVTRRILVQNGHGEVYTMIQTLNGTTYSKNGSPITEASWIKATENAKLQRHF